jgi:hypothetical protein
MRLLEKRRPNRRDPNQGICANVLALLFPVWNHEDGAGKGKGWGSKYRGTDANRAPAGERGYSTGLSSGM